MAIIVVIPYRDRGPQLAKLSARLQQCREVDRVIVCEQEAGDTPFNRGWCKNVGFLLANADPADTVYFHDVDLLPGSQFPGYPAAAKGSVRHLYGHYHCLGGVVGMRACDFRAANGFCNDLWQWGGEDRLLHEACLAARLDIDRSQFATRFARNAYVGEMDAKGAVMAEALARQRFRQALRDGTKPVPDTSHCRAQLDATAYQGVCLWTSAKVWHHVVRPKVQQPGA